MFGSATVETGIVATQFKAGKWRPKKRTTFNHGTTATSAGSVYVNVPLRAMASLPTMPEIERATMTGNGTCPSPAAGIFDVETRGHPFTWTERKPIAWYETFLREACAALVVDLSPGSGAMARACLNTGTEYVGICRTEEHCRWLCYHLNMAAVECICRKGSPLYKEDLAAEIKEHFQETIDELKMKDAAVVDESECEDPESEGE